jgi:hypothetical protein
VHYNCVGLLLYDGRAERTNVRVGAGVRRAARQPGSGRRPARLPFVAILARSAVDT